MDWKYFKQIMRIFLGVCLLLAAAVVLFYNLFLLETGFDAGLALIDFFVFLCGLLLTVFSISALPGDHSA